MDLSLVTPGRNCQGTNSKIKGSSLRWHVIETLKLAPGIVFARSGVLKIVLVDTIIIGRQSSIELGYFTIGNSIVQPIIVTLLGLILGTLVLTANHYGARNYYGCGRVWRRSIKYFFFIGCLGLFFCLFGGEILKFAGQFQDPCLNGGQIIIVIGLGVPAYLIFLASSFLLKGIGRGMPGAVYMVISNLVNFLIFIILVNGSAWNAPFGAEGAAWAATAARGVLAIGMLLYILTMREHSKFGL